MNELEDEVPCPTCLGDEGHCARCHGTGFVRIGDLTEEELVALEQLEAEWHALGDDMPLPEERA